MHETVLGFCAVIFN